MKLGWAISALSLAASALAWAAVEPTRNEKFGLEVTFPEKWIVGSGDEPLLLLSRSMDQVSQANCVATGEQVAMTRGLTQQQINEGMAMPFGEEFWRQAYAPTGLTVQIKSHSARAHASGVMIQEAYFDLSKPGGAPEAKMSVQQAIFVRPGMTLTLACSARAVVYSNSKATLSAILDSVRFVPPAANVAAAQDGVLLPANTGLAQADAAKAAAGASRAGAALLDLSN